MSGMVPADCLCTRTQLFAPTVRRQSIGADMMEYKKASARAYHPVARPVPQVWKAVLAKLHADLADLRARVADFVGVGQPA